MTLRVTCGVNGLSIDKWLSVGFSYRLLGLVIHHSPALERVKIGYFDPAVFSLDVSACQH